MITFKKFLLIKESTRELMPEIYAALEGYDDPMVGVHFSRGIENIKDKRNPTPHLGLRLHPDHHDPIGIYAFPKDYVLRGELINNRGFAESKFFYIVKPSSKARILNLSKISEGDAVKLLNDMGLDPNLMKDSSVYHNSGKKSPAHIFWGVLEKVRQHMATEHKNLSWNILFKDAGYNVLYDEGGGIIHYNEPTQIIYLNSNAMDVLYFGQQKDNASKVFSMYVNSFPDFIPKMKRSGNYFHSRSENELMLNSSDGISILVRPWKGGFSIKTYGYNNNFFKDYNYEDLNKNAINELKDHMIQNRYDLSTVHVEKEKIDPILEKISKRFKIKLKPSKSGRMEILQRYQDSDKDCVIIFRISTYNNKMYFNLSKKHPDNWSVEGYHVNYDFEHNDEQTPEDIINIGLNGLKENMEKYYSDSKQYATLMAIKTIEFLKKRVFGL